MSKREAELFSKRQSEGRGAGSVGRKRRCVIFQEGRLGTGRRKRWHGLSAGRERDFTEKAASLGSGGVRQQLRGC